MSVAGGGFNYAYRPMSTSSLTRQSEQLVNAYVQDSEESIEDLEKSIESYAGVMDNLTGVTFNSPQEAFRFKELRSSPQIGLSDDVINSLTVDDFENRSVSRQMEAKYNKLSKNPEFTSLLKEKAAADAFMEQISPLRYSNPGNYEKALRRYRQYLGQDPSFSGAVKGTELNADVYQPLDVVEDVRSIFESVPIKEESEVKYDEQSGVSFIETRKYRDPELLRNLYELRKQDEKFGLNLGQDELNEVTIQALMDDYSTGEVTVSNTKAIKRSTAASEAEQAASDLLPDDIYGREVIRLAEEAGIDLSESANVSFARNMYDRYKGSKQGEKFNNEENILEAFRTFASSGNYASKTLRDVIEPRVDKAKGVEENGYVYDPKDDVIKSIFNNDFESIAEKMDARRVDQAFKDDVFVQAGQLLFNEGGSLTDEGVRQMILNGRGFAPDGTKLEGDLFNLESTSLADIAQGEDGRAMGVKTQYEGVRPSGEGDGVSIASFYTNHLPTLKKFGLGTEDEREAAASQEIDGVTTWLVEADVTTGPEFAAIEDAQARINQRAQDYKDRVAGVIKEAKPDGEQEVAPSSTPSGKIDMNQFLIRPASQDTTQAGAQPTVQSQAAQPSDTAQAAQPPVATTVSNEEFNRGLGLQQQNAIPRSAENSVETELGVPTVNLDTVEVTANRPIPQVGVPRPERYRIFNDYTTIANVDPMAAQMMDYVSTSESSRGKSPIGQYGTEIALGLVQFSGKTLKDFVESYYPDNKTLSGIEYVTDDKKDALSVREKLDRFIDEVDGPAFLANQYDFYYDRFYKPVKQALKGTVGEDSVAINKYLTSIAIHTGSPNSVLDKIEPGMDGSEEEMLKALRDARVAYYKKLRRDNPDKYPLDTLKVFLARADKEYAEVLQDIK